MGRRNLQHETKETAMKAEERELLKTKCEETRLHNDLDTVHVQLKYDTTRQRL